MRGDLFSGFYPLATDFPPTLNKEDDPTKLKPNESPDCYGVDCSVSGKLKAGVIPTGTNRIATTKTFHGRTYQWYLNRMFRASSEVLEWGAPGYDDKFLLNDNSRYEFDANIVSHMTALSDDVWVATAGDSYILSLSSAYGDRRSVSRLSQEMFVSSAANAVVLGSIPFASNAGGLFSYDGKIVKEWTRKVRNNLGSFSNQAILADYQKGLIIGTSKFVVDTTTEKLFDYGTTGFRFTTRTLVSDDENRPFKVGKIAFLLEHSDTEAGTMDWQTKSEDLDWNDETQIECKYQEGDYTRVEASVESDSLNVHKFAIRLTGLSSNLAIRGIHINVQGFAIGSATE